MFHPRVIEQMYVLQKGWCTLVRLQKGCMVHPFWIAERLFGAPFLDCRKVVWCTLVRLQKD
jgi:hypothetical protein